MNARRTKCLASLREAGKHLLAERADEGDGSGHYRANDEWIHLAGAHFRRIKLNHFIGGEWMILLVSRLPAGVWRINLPHALPFRA